jgi:hypothetical protein
MPLSVDEFDAITHLIQPLPPGRRDEFVAAVTAAVAGRERGPGLVYRTAVSLLPSYFHPPKPTPKPQYFNSRRMRAR